MLSLRTKLVAAFALQGGLLGWIAYEGATHLQQSTDCAKTTKALVEARSQGLFVANGATRLGAGEEVEADIESALATFDEHLAGGDASTQLHAIAVRFRECARTLLPFRLSNAQAQAEVEELQAPLLARVQELETEALGEDNEDAAYVLSQVRRDIDRVRGAIFRYAATAGTEPGEQAKLLIQLSLESTAENLAALHTESDEVEVEPFEDEELREMATEAGTAAARLAVASEKFLASMDGQVEAKAAFDGAADELLAALAAAQASAELTTASAADRNMRRQNTALAVAGGLMLLLAVLLLMQVVRPIVRMAKILRAIGDGECDLSQRLKVSTRDEIGQFAEGFNTFVETIHRTVKVVGDNVVELNRTVEQLDQVATSLNEQASESERHAAQLGEAGGSIGEAVNTAAGATTELATASTQVTEGSREASRLSSVVSETVARVDSAVTQLVDRGSDIERVATVISDLASQTNLLALNAAIEAARAGEAGAGFAVVADEVRDLARRTSEEAAGIGQTISKVHDDSRLAARAMCEVTELVESVGQHQNQICEVVEGLHTTSGNVRDLVETAAQHSVTVAAVCPAVDASTTRTRELAGDTTTMTRSLQQAAEHLGLQVRKFGG